MRLNLATDYFSKLINTTIDENTVIKLSYGQGARAHAWLKLNNFNTNDLNLVGGFTIAQLMGRLKSSSSSQQQQETIPPNSERSSDINTTIGVDIQSISELFPLGIPSDPKSDPELLSIFTTKELSYAQSKPNPLQTLTGLFAAKEAILKCNKKEISLTDLEILPDLIGRPNIEGYSVSISHSLDYAVAIAIQNFYIIKNSEIKEQYSNSRDFTSGTNSVLTGPAKGMRFIDWLIPTLVLGLVAIELLRFLI
jgi:phosphopantetheine--protein transferase-like protein